MAGARTIKDVFIAPTTPAHTKDLIGGLLRRWIRDVDKYANRSKGQLWTNGRKANDERGDAVYWYSERVDVAFFAAAATQKGFMTLLELPHIKRGGSMAPTETKHHRVDLTTFDKHDAMSIWEFKRRNVNVGKDMNADAIAKVIAELIDDAKKVVSDRQIYAQIDRWAGAFVPIRITAKTTSPSNGDLKKLASDVEEMVRKDRITAIAWVFPKATRDLDWEVANTTKRRLYPGVFLALKNIRPPRSA